MRMTTKEEDVRKNREKIKIFKKERKKKCSFGSHFTMKKIVNGRNE
jgi:hypothetical protein